MQFDPSVTLNSLQQPSVHVISLPRQSKGGDRKKRHPFRAGNFACKQLSGDNSGCDLASRSKSRQSDEIHGDQHLDLSRRASLASLAATLIALPLPAAAEPAEVVAEEAEQAQQQAERQQDVDVTITDKVYFDIGMCPEMLNTNRTVGSKTALCEAPDAVGRIVIGLYGNYLPITTGNFKRAVQQGLYKGTIFHKVLPGAYVQAGKQGSKRMGEVFVPKGAQDPNPELMSGASYRLPHYRPGTVSLVLQGNDDYNDLKQARDYRNMQFLITTGPGPVPSLDGENIVFGRVLEGISTVGEVAMVPTFSPGERARQLNAVASFLGDDRAAKARSKWGKPLKAVVITEAGVLMD